MQVLHFLNFETIQCCDVNIIYFNFLKFMTLSILKLFSIVMLMTFFFILTFRVTYIAFTSDVRQSGHGGRNPQMVISLIENIDLLNF